PHATSKISQVSDLDGITTLGFRGEALPSIASVAKVTMVTRPKNQTMATRYIIDNGVEVDFGEIGSTEGTSVTVENLFERIPARKKFLAKSSAEENAITNLVSKFILANPNISFNYSCGERTIYAHNGLGVENAIKCIYGDEYLSKMVKINGAMSDIVLQGYVNKPSFSKHSRSFQTLIVNGRFVENADISYLVYGCYQKYLMSRQYPTYVLYLTVPHDMVDVNVHPNKMEVKFAIPALIKKLISETIKTQILDALSSPKEIDFDIRDDFFTVEEKSDLPFTITTHEPKKTETITSQTETSVINTQKDLPFDEIETPKTEQSKYTSQSDFVCEPKKVNSSALELPRTVQFQSRTSQNTSFSDSATIGKKTGIEQVAIPVQKTRKIIGKLFNTYIVIEQEDEILLIDQHAAHEKILYDRYAREHESGIIATQTMLVPYEFSVSPTESAIISENLDIFSQAGFKITQKTATKFQLKTVPLCCVGINVQSFISDFLSEQNGAFIPDLFNKKLMQTACKSAIKGEDDLSKDEIEALLTAFENEITEFFCPHGRPIVIKLSRREIEKWFKRIV
ncbi:MAG: hypothetical protein IJY70_00965, partial [Clostridia bacterium]|nr:hypothetical protein [Clostridia bacterium]